MLIDLCVVFLPARAVLTVFLPNYLHAFGYPLRNNKPIASERAESKCVNARIVRLFMNKDEKKITDRSNLKNPGWWFSKMD